MIFATISDLGREITEKPKRKRKESMKYVVRLTAALCLSCALLTAAPVASPATTVAPTTNSTLTAKRTLAPARVSIAPDATMVPGTQQEIFLPMLGIWALRVGMVVHRCMANPVCRTLVHDRGIQAGIAWALRHLF